MIEDMKNNCAQGFPVAQAQQPGAAGGQPGAAVAACAAGATTQQIQTASASSKMPTTTDESCATQPSAVPTSDSAATSATTEGSVAARMSPKAAAAATPGIERSTSARLCRKCQGPCPPCKPWRCKLQTSRRSLAELEKTMPATPTSPSHFGRPGMPPMQRSASAYRQAGAPTTENIEKALSQLNIAGEECEGGMDVPRLSRSHSAPNAFQAGGGRGWKSNGYTKRFNNNRDQFSPNYGYTQAGGGYHPNFTDHASLPPPMLQPQPETSHVFLAIAADAPLVKYCATIQKGVVDMPEVPELKTLDDSRCIWPHTVHLTIHSFGKVLNCDIPRIAEYCRQNINVIEPFNLNIGGLFHHQKLYTVGFKVEKKSVEPLRQMKSNMQAWFNKGNNWDGFTPIFSVLRTQTPRGAKFSCQPLSKKSIDTIIAKYGAVKYIQQVNPADIQLCLARSSTETTFYKNLLVDEDAVPSTTS